MPRSLAGLVLAVALLAPTARGQDPAKPLTKIAFGSCADQDKPLPIFDTIAAAKPDLLLLTGDNIYADIGLKKGERATAARIKEKYDILAKLPGFQKLKATCPLLATWDDHDFGKNDAGAEWEVKDEAQTLFLDFFGVPKNDPRRARKGVYHSTIVGPPGKRVQILLLDTRYHRSALKRAPKPLPGERVPPYVPTDDANATVLGAEQWAWLEGELKKPAEVRLLVSSIQVIADEHGYEKWANFPKEREKLYSLIRSTGANGVVILSGDRHLAEVSLDAKAAVGYPLYDVTSSGLNQAAKLWRAPEKNSHRVASLPYGDHFGMVLIEWGDGDPAAAEQAQARLQEVESELTKLMQVNQAEAIRRQLQLDSQIGELAQRLKSDHLDTAARKQLEAIIEMGKEYPRSNNLDRQVLRLVFERTALLAKLEAVQPKKPTRLTLQVRDVDGDVMCGVKVELATLKASGPAVANQPKLPMGVVGPAEAVRKVGEKVTVQFRVASTGGQANLYLNSEKDFRGKDNFAVVLPAKGRPAKWAAATGATFLNKTIRATGVVKLNRENGQIEIAADGQLEIVEK